MAKRELTESGSPEGQVHRTPYDRLMIDDGQ